MSRLLNRVTLIGNLGQDPEIQESKAGIPFATFSIATPRGKSKGGEPETDWHSCVAFDKTAENIGLYLKKGSKVCVEGAIRYETYPNKDHKDVKMYSTKIVVNGFYMLDSKKASNEASQAEREPGQDDDIPF